MYSRSTIDCYKLMVKVEGLWVQKEQYYTETDMKEGYEEYRNNGYTVKIVAGRVPINSSNKQYIGLFHT